MNLNDKPLWQLTTREFVSVAKELFSSKTSDEENKEETTEKKEYVYGISGIANLLGCSKSKVSRIKDTVLKPALITNGRSIIGDAEYLLKLYNQNEEYNIK